jgi:hypothetical protein
VTPQEYEGFASRLRETRDKFDLPLTLLVAGLVRVMARLLAPSEGLIQSQTRNHRRSPLNRRWLWPCSLLPQAVEAIGDPTPDNVGVIDEFFGAVAVLVHLAEKRHMTRDFARAGFAKGFPFLLVAHAQLLDRSRSLNPRPSREQANDLTDIELRTALCIFTAAAAVSMELSTELERHHVAKVCAHCHQLYLRLNRPRFCSDTCGKAFQKRKSHHQT